MVGHRLSHVDVNVQYTAGKTIPLTDYRDDYRCGDASETEREDNERDETEAEEEYVITQRYGLFNFNRTKGMYYATHRTAATAEYQPITKWPAHTRNELKQSFCWNERFKSPESFISSE